MRITSSLRNAINLHPQHANTMPDFTDFLTMIFAIGIIVAMFIGIRKLYKNRDKF